MRAVTLDYESRTLAAHDMPDPVPAAGAVLMRVHEAGVCGTDRELAHFRFGEPPAGETRLIIGHEAVAQIVETGEWVVPTIRRSCSPACSSCARGRRDLCVTLRAPERGITGAHGYFAAYAVDAREDLVPVPSDLIDRAVLIEPLSVVEKALATAFRLHEGEPRTALVIGAGPIGMLAALALSLRGLKVTVHSLQPAEHPRAVLLARAAIRYSAALPRDRFDIAIEAAGAAQAAFAALKALAPLGVLGLLGASSGEGEVSFLDLLVNNQKVFGSVNAGPEAFAAAVGDLPFMDARVLDGMIHRRRFEDFRQSILDEPGVFAKLVHVIE